MTWSEELKEIRTKAKMTVPAMAKKIGVPQRTLENWLGGQKHPNEFTKSAVRERLNKTE